MTDFELSPVPFRQIPHQEFIQLKKSTFYNRPSKNTLQFLTYLFVLWISLYPLFIIISSGDYHLSNNIIKLLLLSLIASTLTPFIVLIRLYLAWNYISKRLEANLIFYEESDWHDGKVWKKPLTWIARDNLIMNEEVIPILSRINITTNIFIMLLLTFISTLYLLKI